MTPEERERYDRIDAELKEHTAQLREHTAEIREHTVQIRENSAQIQQVGNEIQELGRFILNLAHAVEAQKERLDAVIAMVERYLSNGRH